MPIVLDASVFPLIVSQLDLVRGYKGAVLTPNFSEFKNLYKHVCKVIKLFFAWLAFSFEYLIAYSSGVVWTLLRRA